MADKQHILLDALDKHVRAFDDVRRYRRHTGLQRFLFNITRFGLRYIRYQWALRRLPTFSCNIQCWLFFGKNMSLPVRDVGSHIFSLYGILPDKSEQKITRWFIRHLTPRDIFYDIGAHLGYYSALAETLAMRGEVHAFEPNRTLCLHLAHNFRDFTREHISCDAVADKVGESDFYDATDDEDSSTSSRFLLPGRTVAPVRVSTVTIDEYVKKGHTPPTVIKLDIEGGEYDAIVGATNTLMHSAPRIVMEVWGGAKGREYADPAVKKLQELGYQAFTLRADGSAEVEPCTDPVGSISDTPGARDNFLFVKA